MLSVIFIVCIVFIILKLMKRDTNDFQSIFEIQKKIHKYSGVHPEMYEQYISYINLAKQNIDDTNRSKKFLYKSIQLLEEIALYGESGDLDIHEDMTYLIQQLGYEFERFLLNSALNNGIRFIPKYLNEKLDA
ncbi:hypothetical protein [Dishui Lake phycodnavirus 4]|nr:hypothetical protein [Dishui Lake phycodnavirus 4]